MNKQKIQVKQTIQCELLKSPQIQVISKNNLFNYQEC